MQSSRSCSTAHLRWSFLKRSALHSRTAAACPTSARSGVSEDSNTTSSSRRAVALCAVVVPILGAAADAAADNTSKDLLLPMPDSSPYGKVLRVPGDFLRARQRVNGGAKLLAPIKASKLRLKEAEQYVGKVNVYDPNPDHYRNALDMVRTASLNCYGFEALEGDSIETRASQLQRKLGIADACTFRLIAKNVVALLPSSKKDLKAETNRQLQDLIKSYELLDATLMGAWQGDANSAEQVPQALQVTFAHVNSFETCIERCLDLPPSNVAPSAISALSLDRLRRAFGQSPAL